jgi:hypothetical protein
MSFRQKLQLVLDTASTLPLHVDLGQHSCSWENGKLEMAESRQPGFRELTRDELLQLMRRLHAAPHAVLLNLDGHRCGAAVMQKMAAPMAALSKLQVLVMSSESPPPCPSCVFHAHFMVTAAAATTTVFSTASQSWISQLEILYCFLFGSCDAIFVVIMSSTPPPPCIIAAGI